MSRIPYLAENEMSAEQRRRLEELVVLRGQPVSGPGAFWLRNPYLSQCAEPMRQHMELATSLPLALSELAILVAARHWSATYAWCRHEQRALKEGIDAIAIGELRAGHDANFPDDRAAIVYTIALALLKTGGLDAVAYKRGLDAFGLETLIDLIAGVGYGSLVSLANATFEPDPPRGAPDYIPPGIAPPMPTGSFSHAHRLDAVSADVVCSGLIDIAALAWSHRPEIEACARRYDEAIRLHLTMAPETSWLIVLLTVRYWSAQALWVNLHRLASAHGLDVNVIDAVTQRQRPEGLNRQQEIAYDFANELLTLGRPTEGTFELAREYLGLTIMTEIPAIIGFLTMVSLVANVFSPPQNT